MVIKDSIINDILTNYDIGKIISVYENKIGRQTHYIFLTSKGKFFVKVLDCKNENVHKEDEILVCNTLNEKGMRNVPKYIQRIDQGYITKINEDVFFNVQQFIEGRTWAKYEAPDWLLFDAAEFIGDVHNNLKELSLSSRQAITRINDLDQGLYKLERIEKDIIDTTLIQNKDFLLSDIRLRRNIINAPINNNK